MPETSTGWSRALALAVLASVEALGTAGCGPTQQQDDARATSVEQALLGDALPDTNGAAFSAASSNFSATENAVDGSGPIFNSRACGTCHQNGALGGAGQQDS